MSDCNPDLVLVRTAEAAKLEMAKHLPKLGESPEAWRGAQFVVDHVLAIVSATLGVLIARRPEEQRAILAVMAATVSGAMSAVTDGPPQPGGSP